MNILYIDLTDHIILKDSEKYCIKTNEWESFPTYYTGHQDKFTIIDNKLVYANIYHNLKYFYSYKIAYIKTFP